MELVLLLSERNREDALGPKPHAVGTSWAQLTLKKSRKILSRTIYLGVETTHQRDLREGHKTSGGAGQMHRW